MRRESERFQRARQVVTVDARPAKRDTPVGRVRPTQIT